MTEQDLINNGFKKQSADGKDYWYEINVKGGHRFITNDTLYNNRKDKWIIGYENTNYKNDDIFWFNNNLSGEGEFKIIFHVLTGYGWKLAHQRKRITPPQKKPNNNQ